MTAIGFASFFFFNICICNLKFPLSIAFVASHTFCILHFHFYLSLERKEVESVICSIMFKSLRPHGLCMEFSRQNLEWLPFPSPGDLPDSGIKLSSSAFQVDSLLSELSWKPLAAAAAAAAKLFQLCPTLCDPIDSSPPGSPIPVILQARTLDWVAIAFSNA